MTSLENHGLNNKWWPSQFTLTLYITLLCTVILSHRTAKAEELSFVRPEPLDTDQISDVTFRSTGDVFRSTLHYGLPTTRSLPMADTIIPNSHIEVRSGHDHFGAYNTYHLVYVNDEIIHHEYLGHCSALDHAKIKISQSYQTTCWIDQNAGHADMVNSLKSVTISAHKLFESCHKNPKKQLIVTDATLQFNTPYPEPQNSIVTTLIWAALIPSPSILDEICSSQ